MLNSTNSQLQLNLDSLKQIFDNYERTFLFGAMEGSSYVHYYFGGYYPAGTDCEAGKLDFLTKNGITSGDLESYKQLCIVQGANMFQQGNLRPVATLSCKYNKYSDTRLLVELHLKCGY